MPQQTLTDRRSPLRSRPSSAPSSLCRDIGFIVYAIGKPLDPFLQARDFVGKSVSGVAVGGQPDKCRAMQPMVAPTKLTPSSLALPCLCGAEAVRLNAAAALDLPRPAAEATAHDEAAPPVPLAQLFDLLLASLFFSGSRTGLDPLLYVSPV